MPPSWLAAKGLASVTQGPGCESSEEAGCGCPAGAEGSQAGPHRGLLFCSHFWTGDADRWACAEVVEGWWLSGEGENLKFEISKQRGG